MECVARSRKQSAENNEATHLAFGRGCITDGEVVMKHPTIARRAPVRALAAALALGALTGAPTAAKADEGGVSFWIPGFFGSLAASPLVPGFSFANIGYNTSVSAGADVAFARQVTRGNLTVNFSGNLNLNLDADATLNVAISSYTFAQPFLGGQATSQR